MNRYENSMLTFYTDKILSDKNGRPLPDARSLLAGRKLAVALEQKNVRRKNEKRPALALAQGSRKRRNELRLALALL